MIIELDGEVHQYDKNNEDDKIRDEYMKHIGITVLRFENKLIFEYLDKVLQQIEKHFKKV